MSNQDDRILLVDANKNPADEVHYFERGKWAEAADGGGSSLELRDADADNSRGAAWAASDETGRSVWTEYTYRGTANEPLGCCGGLNEFVFGMLDSSEILIDDFSLVKNPGGEAGELVQSGTFDTEADLLNDWTASGDVQWNGSGAARLSNLDELNPKAADIKQSVPTTRSVRYRIQFDLANISGSDRMKYWVKSDSGVKLAGTNVSSGRHSIDVTARDGGLELRFYVQRDQGERSFDVDNVSIEAIVDEFIQNGSFDDGAAHWRMLGTHDRSRVIVDPADPNNRLLHLVADAQLSYMNNRIETTFANRARYVDGREYTISFRAKWITGSNQFRSSLYYNRLAATTHLPVPQNNGTPGLANSQAEANIGPTYDGFIHSPVVPDAGQQVTVSAEIDDPQGVASARLWWSLDSGGWSSTTMSLNGDGRYAGNIPGQSTGRVVQFYVEATDGAGISSTFPAAGLGPGRRGS
ncbi:MAG: hypothetical protein IIA67_14450 [Planctomycetes bacterium]|nr:hypothetical protein [Planctomycetota bacterium]